MGFPAGLPIGSAEGGSPTENSYPDFLDWRQQSRTFDGIASFGYDTVRKYTPSGNGRPLIIPGTFVSSNFFNVVGVAPQYGRSFRRDDEIKGTCSIILNHEFWVSEFGKSVESVGGPIHMSDRACTIVGVMPAGFHFPYQEHAPEFWATFAYLQNGQNTPVERRGDRDVMVLARLRKGYGMAQANAEMNAIQRGLAQSYAEDRNYSGIEVSSLLSTLTGDYRKSLLLLFGAVAGVLLIACVNVAGLLMARGVIRKDEFAVRMALGASRGQIIRQVLTESTILSCASGIVGVALGFLFLRRFLEIVPLELPRLGEVHMDGTTMGFAVIVCLLTGVGFGVLPAWIASRSDATLALGRGRATSGGQKEHRIHGGLAVAEIAISLVLLAGSGLLIRSFVDTMRVNPGFDTHGMLTFRLGMSGVEYPRVKAMPFLRQVRTKLAGLPGVKSVTGSYPLPFTYDDQSTFRLEGVAYDPSDPPSAKIVGVAPLYFETLKIPLLSGRTFDERDDAKAKKVAVVDAEFARRFFPKGDAIGKSIEPDMRFQNPLEWYEIVGIVGSIRTSALTNAPDPQFYLPYEQAGDWPEGIILRTEGDPRAHENEVRAAIAEMNRDLPVFDLSTVDERVSQSMGYARFEAQLLTCFAVVALLLAAVGLYATLSEMVARRTFEIGLRVALGALPGDVFQLVVKRGLGMAALGLILGLAGFWVASRVFADMVYGVAPFDLWAILAAGAVLVGVSIVASAWPAWKAMQLEPMKALREE
jgi:putative ABC transport system permease protein